MASGKMLHNSNWCKLASVHDPLDLYFSVNAPQGSLPLLVNGTNGGLSACTNAGPGIAPLGSVMVKRVELTRWIGILAAPAAVSPPRFTVPPFWVLKKLITVRF